MVQGCRSNRPISGGTRKKGDGMSLKEVRAARESMPHASLPIDPSDPCLHRLRVAWRWGKGSSRCVLALRTEGPTPCECLCLVGGFVVECVHHDAVCGARLTTSTKTHSYASQCDARAGCDMSPIPCATEHRRLLWGCRRHGYRTGARSRPIPGFPCLGSAFPTKAFPARF
jgi:hypothetical protein